MEEAISLGLAMTVVLWTAWEKVGEKDFSIPTPYPLPTTHSPFPISLKFAILDVSHFINVISPCVQKGLSTMNLSSILESAAARFKDKAAIVINDSRVSYASLEADANKVAHALMKLGVTKGDRVAMLQSANPEFVAAFFGIMKAGGIAVPVDTRYVPAELEILFKDCTPKVLVIENASLTPLLPFLSRFASLKHIITVGAAPDAKFIRYEEIIAQYPAEKVSVKVKPEDIAVISYTGGPTLQPRGVALSHGAICTEVKNSVIGFEQTEKDVMVLFALPMYHQFGLTAATLGSIDTGSTIVIVPGTGRSIDSFMEAVQREKGTMFMGVPYIYSLMINVARRAGIKYDLSSLRLLASGGAPLEPVVVERFKEVYGFDIHDIYGQTESVCHVCLAPPRGPIKPGSSGKALPCWEMKIFDKNDNEVASGTEGEIVLRGPVMSGFWNHPEETAEALQNGWLHTGDLGWMDEDGYLFITSRKRRMLILKGQNIFPADIEEVLMSHPEVAETKAFGAIDLIRGETVKAIVRLKKGSAVTGASLRQYCQGRMADYKLPREIILVDKMPDEAPLWRRPTGLTAADLMMESKE
jgi:long-chain acyl-CoA synthetase